MTSCSSGWAGSLDEADVTIELPCRQEDYLKDDAVSDNLAFRRLKKRSGKVETLTVASLHVAVHLFPFGPDHLVGLS